jgi:hypothetical protein
VTGARYFHGGTPGLRPGHLVLPPSETGAETWGDILRKHNPEVFRTSGHRHSRRDRVYMGSGGVAAAFAGGWTLNACMPGDGAVYEVQPAGKVEPDPCPCLSWPDEECWMCPRAVIVRVVKAAMPRSVILSLMRREGKTERDLELIESEHAVLARARAEGRQVTQADYFGLAEHDLTLRMLGL